jgi:hypothetical protein
MQQDTLPVSFSQSQVLTRILLAITPPGFSKGGKEEGSLHCFIRILVAMMESKKKGTIIQQESVIYLSWLRHG